MVLSHSKSSPTALKGKSVSLFKNGSILHKLYFFSLGINVTNHEEHALLRRFDHNRDGSISMEEFYNTLAQEFWA